MGYTTECSRESFLFKRKPIAHAREWSIEIYFTYTNSSFVKNSELGFDILFVDGHTEKMMLPHLQYNGKTIVFTADLIPTVGHVPVPYLMGYDTRPLLTLNEKGYIS